MTSTDAGQLLPHRATTDETHAAMRSYAAMRGLRFEGAGLLPPVTQLLTAGLGRGVHRAGVLKVTRHTTSTSGQFTKRPERFSENLCTGVLPGRLDGTLAHHSHLTRISAGPNSRSWVVAPATVILARVPEACRVVRTLVLGPASKLIATRTESVGPPLAVPVWLPPELAERFVVSVSTPDSRSDRMHALLDPFTAAVLPTAADELRVELQDGLLEVHLPSYVAEPDELDRLCRLAADIAAMLRRISARQPAFDPALPLPPPAEDERKRWFDQHLSTVRWKEPPPDAPTATAVLRQQAGRDASLGTALNTVSGRGVPGPIGLLLRLLPTRKVAGVVQQAGTDRLAAGLGLEAFAREYARSRGLVLEDPDELRIRFGSPFPGVPLKSMYGDLGAGVHGRVVFWADVTDRTGSRPSNLVIVPVRGTAAQPRPGYQVFSADGYLALAEPIDAAGRSVERMDALRAEAVRLTTSGAS